MRRVFLLALWIALCVWPASALAGDELRVETEILVPLIQRLEVNPAVVTLPSPTAMDFSAGYLEFPEPILLTIYSNAAWEVAVRSDWDQSESAGGAAKEVIPLLWRTEDRPSLGLTDEWTVVGSGEPCAAGSFVQIRIRIPLSWTMTLPGLYEPRLEYRLSPVGP